VRAYLRSLDPRLPRDVWILQVGGLLNMFGNGVIAPFLIIYLHNVRGISLGVAGLIAASNSGAGLVSGFIGGALSDRLGPKRVLAGSLIVMAVAFSLFPLIRSPWQALLLNMLAGAGSGSFWPSQGSLVNDLTPVSRRHAAFAQQRMTMNLGIAFGGLVAGLIARTSNPTTFTVLFLLNAVTFLLYVAVLQIVKAPAQHDEHHEPGTYRGVMRDRVFMAYIALNVVFIGAGIAVAGELFPPFAKNTAHVTEKSIGVIWFVTSMVIALAQLPVVKLVEGRRRMPGLALMGVIWAASFLGILVGGRLFTGTEAALVFGGALTVFVLGECLHGAIYAPLVADLAEPRLVGRYMAFSSFSWQLGFLIGPAAGGFVLQHAPLALWPGAAAILLGASVYALALERWIPQGVRLTPKDSVAGVTGTMANMIPTADDPFSTDAKPAPHPSHETSRVRGGDRPARRTTPR
jgi:MFS family permease